MNLNYCTQFNKQSLLGLGYFANESSVLRDGEAHHGQSESVGFNLCHKCVVSELGVRHNTRDVSVYDHLLVAFGHGELKVCVVVGFGLQKAVDSEVSIFLLTYCNNNLILTQDCADQNCK